MTVPAGWKRQPGTVVAEIEAWTIGDAQAVFATNVNVLTQTAPGMDLRRYLNFSAEGIKAQGQLDSQEIVQGAGGHEVGVLRYSTPSPQDLRYLAVVAVKNERAIVATLTALPNAFADAANGAEPYLRTLVAT